MYMYMYRRRHISAHPPAHGNADPVAKYLLFAGLYPINIWGFLVCFQLRLRPYFFGFVLFLVFMSPCFLGVSSSVYLHIFLPLYMDIPYWPIYGHDRVGFPPYTGIIARILDKISVLGITDHSYILAK